MNYKGYIGTLHVDQGAMVLRGHVINTRDTITFQGKSVEEASAAFRESVDSYLEFCASVGEAPEKPFSGKFMVRVQPEVHRALSALAQAQGISLNRFIQREFVRLAKMARTRTEGAYDDAPTLLPPRVSDRQQVAAAARAAKARAQKVADETKAAATPPKKRARAS